MLRSLLTILFTLILLAMAACTRAEPLTPRSDSGSAAENSLPATTELLESADFSLNAADFNLRIDTFNVIYDKERDFTCWIVYQGDGYNSGVGMYCLKGKY